MNAQLSDDEAGRLEALRQYGILDTAPEQEFDDLTHLAAQICGTPISAVTLVDEERQWFKSRLGLDILETPRDVSFCAHAILENGLMLIPDASVDERFADNPFVTSDPHIRFYAGVPLVTPEGQAIGTLCVLDTVPHQLDGKQTDALVRLGRQAVTLLEARPATTTEKGRSRQARQRAEHQRLLVAAETARRDADKVMFSEVRYRRLFEAAQDGILILNVETGQIEDINPFLCELLGYVPDDFLGKQLWEIGTFRDIVANQDAFRELQERRYIRYDDLPLETKNGHVISVEFVSNVYMCAEKEVVQCNIRDITARKRAKATHAYSVLLEAKVQERTQDLERAQIDTLQRLAIASEYRDDETGLHTKRVGVTAGRIAEMLNLPRTQVDLILRSAPLHDVGKIGITDAILLKPGKLTDEEFDTMRQHTVIGAKILSGSASPWLQMAEEIALTHHERWDGRGYPQRLAGENIALVGRIVAVADVFDALTHERPYKKAWPVEDAIAEIQQQSGKQFDPVVVAAFSSLDFPGMPLSSGTSYLPAVLV
ncbi:cyclic di-GMP phosphodiesterase [Abditibacteriota bacterium]|nr:cyclic di-GMP phosphodiesterase [Abditibacteriota bacterium]